MTSFFTNAQAKDQAVLTQQKELRANISHVLKEYASSIDNLAEVQPKLARQILYYNKLGQKYMVDRIRGDWQTNQTRIKNLISCEQKIKQASIILDKIYDAIPAKMLVQEIGNFVNTTNNSRFMKDMENLEKTWDDANDALEKSEDVMNTLGSILNGNGEIGSEEQEQEFLNELEKMVAADEKRQEVSTMKNSNSANNNNNNNSLAASLEETDLETQQKATSYFANRRIANTQAVLPQTFPAVPATAPLRSSAQIAAPPGRRPPIAPAAAINLLDS